MRRKKRILYVFDDINYKNGVQKVTAMQVSCLKETYDISLFSLTRPDESVRELFSFVPIIGEEVWDLMRVFACPLKQVYTSRRFSLSQQLVRLLYAFSLRAGLHNIYLNFLLSRRINATMNSFDLVIVLSESSKMRNLVSNLKGPRKIQWIHTDYGRWCRLNDWTKSVSRHDRALYCKFDIIVTLSKSNQESFVKVFPEFRDKTVVVWNMIPVHEIIQKSMLPLPDNVEIHAGLKIVTISRLDREKALDRLLNVCKRLKIEGYRFHWYLVGGGNLYDNIIEQINKLQLEDTVILTGELENPLPLLRRCDLFALLSKYEGMPVTIHEAMLLGVPVIATNVGGISEQIENGINGMLVENDEEAIINGLKTLLDNPAKLKKYGEQLKNYVYNNQRIVAQLKSLFDNLVEEGDK